MATKIGAEHVADKLYSKCGPEASSTPCVVVSEQIAVFGNAQISARSKHGMFDIQKLFTIGLHIFSSLAAIR